MAAFVASTNIKIVGRVDGSLLILPKEDEQLIERLFDELRHRGNEGNVWALLRANGFVLTGSHVSIERLRRSTHPSAQRLVANVCEAVPYSAPYKNIWSRLLDVFRRPTRLDPARDKVFIVKAMPGADVDADIRAIREASFTLAEAQETRLRPYDEPDDDDGGFSPPSGPAPSGPAPSGPSM